MQKTDAIIRAMPLVASILGNRLGVAVDIGSHDTACTDGRTIYLPPLPVDGDENLLGTIRSYIDHESAHIRYTVFEDVENARLSPLGKFLWNAIEDWRVEHELITRYPGCHEHFQWMIRHLLFGEEQEAEARPSASCILSYVLLTLRSWDVEELIPRREKEGQSIERQWPGLRAKLDGLLKLLPDHCHSTRDSIDFARKMVALLEQEESPQSQAQSEPSSQAGGTESLNKSEGNHQPKPEDTRQDSKECPTESPTSRSEQASRDVQPESGDANASQTQGQPSAMSEGQAVPRQDKQGLRALLNAAEQDLPPTLDTRLAGELNLMRQGWPEPFTRMAVEGRLSVQALSRTAHEESMAASRALGTRLQALMQAKALRRAVPGRSGRLDGRLLYRVAVDNPHVFLKREERQAVNTAVHILLDVSGSMKGKMRLASSACYAVTSALASIPGINVGVTAFPAVTPDGAPGVCPLVRHGQRPGTDFGLKAGGSTPLAEALWWMGKVFLSLTENRRILLLITDGEPNDPQMAVAALEELRRLGIEVMGIAVRSPHLGAILPIQAQVNDMSELAGAMFNLLLNHLASNKEHSHGV